MEKYSENFPPPPMEKKKKKKELKKKNMKKGDRRLPKDRMGSCPVPCPNHKRKPRRKGSKAQEDDDSKFFPGLVG